MPKRKGKERKRGQPRPTPTLLREDGDPMGAVATDRRTEEDGGPELTELLHRWKGRKMEGEER